jgi:hypothetical protein
MRNKLFIVLVVLAVVVLLPAQMFAGKPPKSGTADPGRSQQLGKDLRGQRGREQHDDRFHQVGLLHKPLLFPDRRAVLYHYGIRPSSGASGSRSSVSRTA